MANLKFELQLSAQKEKLMKLSVDYANYVNYLPNQIKSVTIIEKKDKNVITEEKLFFGTIKKTLIQKSLHRQIDSSKLYTEIISGPFKGSQVIATYEENSKGTLVKVDADLKLPLRYKLLSLLVQRSYKMVLTSVLYKMNTVAISS